MLRRAAPIPTFAILLLLVALSFHIAPSNGAEDLTLDGDFVQGGLVRGQTAPGAKVTLGDRKLRVNDDGGFVFGFHRNAGEAALLTVVLPEGQVIKRPLAVGRRSYDVQRIDGLPSSKVTPPAEVMARIQREIALVKKARAIDSPRDDYRADFIWPVTGPISGVYGSQRILNGQPRQPHYGIDIAVPTGTPVQAPAGGVVVLAEPDLYFSGGTLMLDHGHGVMSAFLHLDSIDVAMGQEVHQGDVIATVGATGRVTGAHLDWRVNWFEERVDAGLLVPPMPNLEGSAN